MTHDEWREWRRGHLGASDMSAVLGVDEFRGPRDVYYSKVYPSTDRQKSATRAGHRLECVALDAAEDVLGIELDRGPMFEDQPKHVGIQCKVSSEPIGVTLDASLPLGDVPRVPVEAKTTGIEGEPWGHWGDQGTDDIPVSGLVQVQTQMLATGSQEAYVTALIGGRGHVMYRVPRSKDMQAEILDKSRWFWDRYIVTMTPPPEQAVRLETLACIERHAGSVVDASRADIQAAQPDVSGIQAMFDAMADAPDFVAAYQQLGELAKAAERARKETQALILALLGDAEEVHLDDGRRITYREQGRESVDKRKLMAQYLEAFEACRTETRYRVLRVHKAKQ